MENKNLYALIRRTGAIHVLVRLLAAIVVVLLAFFLHQALAHGHSDSSLTLPFIRQSFWWRCWATSGP